MDLRAAARGEMGKQRIDDSFRRKRAQADGRRDIARFHQQQGRCAASPREPGRERVGGRFPGGGDLGRGEDHRGGEPDRDPPGRERSVDFAARGGEDEAIRMAGEDAAKARHGEQRAAMRLDVVKALYGLSQANFLCKWSAARNKDQRVACCCEGHEPGFAVRRIGEAAAELGDEQAQWLLVPLSFVATASVATG